MNNRIVFRFSVKTIFFTTCVAAVIFTGYRLSFHYTPGQQLVIASFNLDVECVKTLLVHGVDPNARMGKHHRELFTDKWTLGTPMATAKWTPLIAVAESHRAPQPHQPAKNTAAGLDEAMEKLSAIDPKIILERDKRRVAIAKLLVSAKSNLDVHDGYGATALECSIYNGYDELSLFLIASGAKLDTKTGVYIDGAGDITPMHRATKSPEVLAAMIQRGASVNPTTTMGETPLHWAVSGGHIDSVRLLLASGANVNVMDNEGRLASYWCQTYGDDEFLRDANKKEIARLLGASSSQW